MIRTPTPLSLLLLGSAVVHLACGEPSAHEPDDNTSDALATGDDATLWDARENTIPLCWMSNDFSGAEDFLDEKRLIQSAIERTWAAVAPLRFVWSDTCGADQTAVRIQLGEHGKVLSRSPSSPAPEMPTDALDVEALIAWVAEYQAWYEANLVYDHSSDGQATVGMAALSHSNDDMSGPGKGNRGMSIWIERHECKILGCNKGSLEWPRRLEYIAVHEMGHVLGFAHEQDRKDNPGDCERAEGGDAPEALGPYDPDSVMNYCNSFGNGAGILSEGDISAVRRIYGWKVARPTALADVDGDGRADPIAVNADAIYVRTHRWLTESAAELARFGTTTVQATSASFYGDRETAFADVDGDGRADAIAINADGVYVMRSVSRSDGSIAFDGWSQWSPSFYGSRRTLVGDVTGDGRADVVAVDEDSVLVAVAAEGHFVGAPLFPGDLRRSLWSGAFFGSIATHLADVDGDGRADLIANNGARGIFVSLSDGRRFLPPSEWRSALVGERGHTFADVTGDHRADLIVINDDGIYVAASDGASFNGAIHWTVTAGGDRHPFFGDRATLFADVDGDGDADAVAVNDAGLWVELADRYRFDLVGAWSGPFYSL